MSSIPSLTLIAVARYLLALLPRDAIVGKDTVDHIVHYLWNGYLKNFNDIALSALILDRLSWTFIRTWKTELNKMKTVPESTKFLRSPPPQTELIVLAAFTIAFSWLEDRLSLRPSGWLKALGEEQRVPIKDFDATIRCVLRNIDYNLCQFPVELVEDMKKDLWRESASQTGALFASEIGKQPPLLDLKSTGAAVLNEGLVTPELTPTELVSAQPGFVRWVC